MKQLCVVTGTRAEYGLLKPLICAILEDAQLQLTLVVTGMHLCPEFGLTYQEIVADGFTIDEKIEILLSSDTTRGMTKSVGLAMLSFAEYFERKRPDMLVVLGDRYEIFACATAAAMAFIPIAHLYGGDTTEGAVDEFLRHSITKMSYLHFVSTDVSKKRVEQLGESPDRVFNYGALGVENILSVPLLSKPMLEKSIEFELNRNYALVTFHPVTMENESAHEQFGQLLTALDRFADLKFIFTKANSDANGRIINAMIDDYVESRSNCVAFTSMGMLRYLSAMKYASLVIGNSSSGLYETPSFHIPTINIGDRQRGRLQASSIINCSPVCDDIACAIERGLSPEWVNIAKQTVSPFGSGNTSKRIVAKIEEFLLDDKIDMKKKFYDLEV
ncbi:UDP-N-acetylglucosamine 2-epimerase [Oscillospiraceae bacterium PP1C4]